MDEEASIILGDAIAFCQRDGQDARLINMLGQSRAISLTEDTLTIEAPSRFAIAQLKKHQPTIEAYLEEIAFAPIALDIVAPQGAATESAAATAPATAPAASPAVPASAGDVPTIEHQHSDVSRETMAPLTSAAATSTNAPVTHMPIAHDAAAGADSGIAIKNTLSADDFRRMMNQMKGGAPTKSTQAAAPASPMPAPTVPAEQNTDGAPLAANSKFTFENFVYGPENSHAYRSALKFAALADERGTCTSLFIYGKSGLGKTHLLLAIKNELAEKSPEIKVKYANSQAYLDDLMTEFDRQKKSNAPIMQAYHGVDVLINVGDGDTAHTGGGEWEDPAVAAAVRGFVYNGGGIVGVGEPSGHQYEGHYLQLAGVLGVEKETGFTLGYDKYNWDEHPGHFILEDCTKPVDFGEGKKGIYALPDTEILVQREKEVQMAVHAFGKGRAVYISGLPYSFENSRVLYRSILWSAHDEESLHKWFSSNFNVEVHAYVKNGKYCVVNNTYEPQSTVVYKGDGSSFALDMAANEIKWYEI